MENEKPIKEIGYEAAACACCDEKDNFETLWENRVVAETRQNRWQFDNNVIICKNCGFVFTSPVPSEKTLSDYYSDTWAYYGSQEIDYSIEKRIDFIKRHMRKKGVFVEIGSNQKNEFQQDLERVFTQVRTLELNENIESDYTTVHDVPADSADMIAHYFVLEHVACIDPFLRRCSTILKEDGIMICEVPDISLYPSDFSGLILHEHLNHFSAGILSRICRRYGFWLLECSSQKCSRKFGFVAAFQKTGAPDNKEPGSEISEYRQNKELVLEGVNKVHEYMKKIEDAYQLFERKTREKKKILFWGANHNLKRFLECGTVRPEDVLIIDSDPAKKTFSYRYAVHTPSEEKTGILECESLFIFSRRNAKDILHYLDDTLDKQFDAGEIFIVDN